MNIEGVYGSEWEKFHPEQFISIWKLEEYIVNFKVRLVIWGYSKASNIPEYLSGKEFDDFILEPINEIGGAISLVEAIERREKYVSG